MTRPELPSKTRSARPSELRRKASRTCQREERRLIAFRLSAMQMGYRLMGPNGARVRRFDLMFSRKWIAARGRLG
jgi:hypothetical protein